LLPLSHAPHMSTPAWVCGKVKATSYVQIHTFHPLAGWLPVGQLLPLIIRIIHTIIIKLEESHVIDKSILPH
jgi:hypothetical protein